MPEAEEKKIAAFGAPLSLIWLLCLVSFAQGFSSFEWTTVSYHLKDGLKLSPSASQFLYTVAFLPWLIKPLYGILSDSIPIGGRKRIPYLFFATFLSLLSWLILGLNDALRSSRWPLVALLTLQNIGSAMSNVVFDAMLPEAVTSDSEQASCAGRLWSLSWLATALGVICGDLLGGYALNSSQMATKFLLFSILPAVRFFSCCLVEETPAGTLDNSAPNGTGNSIPDEDGFATKEPDRSTKRRNKGRKTKRKTVISSKKREPLAVKWLSSLKEATDTLWRALRQPMILRSMTWFFLALGTVPNMSMAQFYYRTEFLKLDESFLRIVHAIGWFSALFGTFTYHCYLETIRLRKTLLLAQVGIALFGLFDIILVSRMNSSFGISDKFMVLCGSALADAVYQLKLIPLMILSRQLCPTATLFSLFMSFNNFGTAIGSFVGAGLFSFLNISSGSFDNLLLGLAIQMFCNFIPIAFLFLIPEEVTGKSSKLL